MNRTTVIWRMRMREISVEFAEEKKPQNKRMVVSGTSGYPVTYVIVGSMMSALERLKMI